MLRICVSIRMAKDIVWEGKGKATRHCLFVVSTLFDRNGECHILSITLQCWWKVFRCVVSGGHQVRRRRSSARRAGGGVVPGLGHLSNPSRFLSCESVQLRLRRSSGERRPRHEGSDTCRMKF